MDKQKAIDLFGSASELARILACTRSAISQWPNPLPRRIADRVIAAAVRSGKDPSELMESEIRKTA